MLNTGMLSLLLFSLPKLVTSLENHSSSHTDGVMEDDKKIEETLAIALDEQFDFCRFDSGKTMLCRPAIGIGPVAFASAAFPLRLASPEDGCSDSWLSQPLHNDGFILLVARGRCSFLQKALRAQMIGAKAVLVADYTSNVTLMRMSHGGDVATAKNVGIPLLAIRADEGARLRKTLLEKQTLILKIRFEKFWEDLAERKAFEETLKLYPENAQLHFKAALRALKGPFSDRKFAHDALKKCLFIRPTYTEAHLALASLLDDDGKSDIALKYYISAHESDPKHDSDALYRLAWAYLRNDQKENAKDAYTLLWHHYKIAFRAYAQPEAVQPMLRSALGNLARLELQTASWQNIEYHWVELERHLHSLLFASKNSASWRTLMGIPDPTHTLGHPFRAEIVYAIAEKSFHQANNEAAITRRKLNVDEGYRLSNESPKKGTFRCLRVAYISVDLDNSHPVGQKMVHIVGMHNHTAVVTSVLALRSSLMPPTPFHIRKSWEQSSPSPSVYHEIEIPSHIEFQKSGSRDAVVLAEDIMKTYVRDRIDVVVNVDGHAGQIGKGVRVRNALLSHSAMPPVLTAFGYHSHVASSSRLLTDSIVLADDHQPPAQLIRHALISSSSFIGVNNDLISYSPNRRNDRGILLSIPWDITNRPSVVFCNFGDLAKITPQVWQSWMNILSRTPGSIIWLMKHSQDASPFANLQSEMEARGISKSRLKITERLPEDIHLLVKSHADLYLDTIPYNSHTTGHEALIAGVPVITNVGQTISGRIMASVLHYTNLSYLVCNSRQEFENVAVAIGQNIPIMRVIHKNVAASDFLPTKKWMQEYERILSAMSESAKEERSQTNARQQENKAQRHVFRPTLL